MKKTHNYLIWVISFKKYNNYRSVVFIFLKVFLKWVKSFLWLYWKKKTFQTEVVSARWWKPQSSRGRDVDRDQSSAILEIFNVKCLLLFSQFMQSETFCLFFTDAISETRNILLVLPTHSEPCSLRLWSVLEKVWFSPLAGRFGLFPNRTRVEENTALSV